MRQARCPARLLERWRLSLIRKTTTTFVCQMCLARQVVDPPPSDVPIARAEAGLRLWAKPSGTEKPLISHMDLCDSCYILASRTILAVIREVRARRSRLQAEGGRNEADTAE